MADEIQAGCFGRLFRRKAAPRQCVEFVPPEKPTSKHTSTGKPGDKEETDDVHYFSPCCDFSYGPAREWWSAQDSLPPYTSELSISSCDDKDIAYVIEKKLDEANSGLRQLSLEIHDNPELMFQERYAHDILTKYMSDNGFKVTKHYLGLETAWRAEYTQGVGGRVIGVNSEMDALPGIGHACGHNLIAIAGVGVAIALRAALRAQPHVSGTVVLLGTPAEEGGGGKAILLERGAYKGMDICIMCHPSPGAPRTTSVGSSNAMQSLKVEYFGHSAHAGSAPWEGTNALDAAFIAYSSISMLRQQMKPDHRVHGIVEGKNWAANVIPDYAHMRWIARAPTSADLIPFVKRVQNCLQAAALATGCKIKLTREYTYFDLHQNPVLAQGFADIVGSRYGLATTTQNTSASTDFGNVTYALPALHPAFAIPTQPNGGNHTAAFADAARGEAAHVAVMTVTKGLALTGYRVLTDSQFFSRVQASFEQSKLTKDIPDL
ncbi:amidohydrolase [Agrocybe pediades]|nr:amidohydrolase [Agrocybe pediades]